MYIYFYIDSKTKIKSIKSERLEALMKNLHLIITDFFPDETLTYFMLKFSR